MKKERMITRTIKSTEITIMAVNTTNASVFDKVITVVGEYDMSNALEVARENDTETEKAVMVKACTVNETLYGVPESEFLKIAKVLPPRTNNED